MNSKSVLILVAAVFVLASGSFVFFQLQQKLDGGTFGETIRETIQTPSEMSGTTADSPDDLDDDDSPSYGTPAPYGTPASYATPTGPTRYTSTEVAKHATASSCWTIIDGNAYDLTKWIPQHPGGEQAIKSLCGKDGTSAFHGQHDNAQKQADILATFKIGVLVQ